ncbi:hypothetical protein ZOD2009_05792 [Haladaptatus paucihalophilus DX253]|uniref:Uncharacterized protein n=1 Tax=Haladaptatus paucihalophilus DX253 TaxID=797209 RepID=E7QQT8_HALPU|nr:hypothetical protein [Haladaptatus paucihalophilus]EFW93352.1 hypothetical protein ZOD2009_05792 [Haladaptatus paucihalophilus DX253]SHK52257.1 hypothetical protein SAMN05444342_1541 [Haladaptatus paucihalophilus DX253]
MPGPVFRENDPVTLRPADEEGVSRRAAYVDGEWCDVVRYGLLRDERESKG